MTTPATAPISLLDCLATLGDDGSHGLLQYGGQTFYRAGTAVNIPAAPSLLDMLGLDASPTVITVTVVPPPDAQTPDSGSYTTGAWTASSPTAGVTWAWAFVGATPAGATINPTGNTATVTIADAAALGVGAHLIDLRATATLGGTSGVGSATTTITVPVPPLPAVTGITIGRWTDLVTGTTTFIGFHDNHVVSGTPVGTKTPANGGINNALLEELVWSTSLGNPGQLTVVLGGALQANHFATITIDGNRTFDTSNAVFSQRTDLQGNPASEWVWPLGSFFPPWADGAAVPVAFT